MASEEDPDPFGPNLSILFCESMMDALNFFIEWSRDEMMEIKNDFKKMSAKGDGEPLKFACESLMVLLEAVQRKQKATIPNALPAAPSSASSEPTPSPPSCPQANEPTSPASKKAKTA